jgi:polysaccharide deacetylase family protein (PEP-CTERM system associated)
MPDPSPTVFNAFTVDVEDFYHIIGSAYDEPSSWESLPSRTEVGVDRVLDICAELSIRATMFVLGAEARRNPALIKHIAQAGHEIACHGMYHRLVTSFTPTEFRDDLRECKALLEDLTGHPVAGFRAPGYSITPAVPWAFDVLDELGFLYDSSIVPARVKHGGWQGAPTTPYRAGNIVELPVASSKVMGKVYVWGAGGRLRITPGFLIRRWWRKINAEGVPAVVLVHPRELDNAMPQLDGLSWKRRLISGWGVKSYPRRLLSLLQSHQFSTCKEIAEAWTTANG